MDAYEVVIVGSGVAGSLLAWKLARGGRKVLILEAGETVRRADAARSYAAHLDLDRTYPRSVDGPSYSRFGDYYVQKGKDPFTGYYDRQRGGSTWHWLGTCLRFLPEDFELRRRYGVGVDWPIAYADLEPFYEEAETCLGVSGQEPLGSPRSSGYPMPALPATYLEQRLGEAARRRGYQVQVMPAARNSQPYQGRPACCGSATCVPICPIGAKYDATVHLKLAEEAGATVWCSSPVVSLTLDGVRLLDGRTVRGGTVILACNAIETPRLLLMSGFRHEQVGRNLMGMAGQISWALAPEPVWPYRSPQVVSGIVQFRSGEFRRKQAAFALSIGNDGWPRTPAELAAELIEQGLEGRALRKALQDHLSRELLLVSNCEELPDAENRVELSDLGDAQGLPRPKVTYRTGAYTRAGIDEAVLVHARIFDEMGATMVNHVEESADPAHIAGTCRMGHDARTCVVDANLRCHENPKLYVLGSSVFPSVGTAPPTLTVAALALRLAAHLSVNGPGVAPAWPG